VIGFEKVSSIARRGGARGTKVKEGRRTTTRRRTNGGSRMELKLQSSMQSER